MRIGSTEGKIPPYMVTVLTSSGAEGALEGNDVGIVEGDEVDDGLVESEGCRDGALKLNSPSAGFVVVVGELFSAFLFRYAIADLLTQLKSSLGRNFAVFLSHNG